MTITTLVHNAILESLRVLAALDPDRADLRNRRGHQLAALPTLSDRELDEGRVLVARYSGQLSSNLVRAALPPPPPPVPRMSLADALDEWAAFSQTRRAA